jgi:MFS family permease
MRRSLVLYFSSELFLSLGIGIVSYVQPFFYRSYGASDSTIGVLFAVNAAAAGLSALLLGPVADWIGASRVFKFSTFLLAFSFLLMGLTHNTYLWMATSALSGIGGALLMSTENVVLSSLTKGKEMAAILSKFVALYMFLIGLGTVFSGFISSRISYQDTFIIGAIVALIAPGVRLFVKAPDARSHRAFRLPSRRIALMSLYALLFGVAIGIFRPFATLVLQSNFGLGDRTTAAVSAASLFMISVGAFIVSTLLRHFKQSKTLMLSFATGGLLTLWMAVTGNAMIFSSLYLLRTITTSIPGSIVDALFLEVTPKTEFAQMFGVRVFGNSIGNAIGSYGGGYLLEGSHISVMLILSTLMLSIAYFYLTYLIARMRRKPSQSVEGNDSLTSKGMS